MYLRRPGSLNFTRPVPLTDRTVSDGDIVSVGKSFARHCMEAGPVSMTGYARLEQDTARYGGYHRIDGIERAPRGPLLVS